MRKTNRRREPARCSGSAADRAEADRAVWPSQRGQDHAAGDVLSPGLERPSVPGLRMAAADAQDAPSIWRRRSLRSSRASRWPARWPRPS